jgi:hypothetical protein
MNQCETLPAGPRATDQSPVRGASLTRMSTGHLFKLVAARGFLRDRHSREGGVQHHHRGGNRGQFQILVADIEEFHGHAGHGERIELVVAAARSPIPVRTKSTPSIDMSLSSYVSALTSSARAASVRNCRSLRFQVSRSNVFLESASVGSITVLSAFLLVSFQG